MSRSLSLVLSSLVVLLALVLPAAGVSAQEAEPAQPVQPIDYVLMPAAGALGGTLGGLVGGTVAGRACGDDFLCIGDALGGAALGYTVGSLGVMYGYGDLRNLQGSVWGMGLGYVAGMGSAVLLATQVDNSWVWFGGFLLLPSIGGTVGYMLGTPDPVQQQTRGNLLNYDPGAGLRLGAPAVGVSTANDDTRVTVPLLGGTF